MQVFWDVLLFVEHQEGRANRVDVIIINHMSKGVIRLEMSCSWFTNWEKYKGEKTRKYGLLHWELKQKDTK